MLSVNESPLIAKPTCDVTAENVRKILPRFLKFIGHASIGKAACELAKHVDQVVSLTNVLSLSFSSMTDY